MKKSTSFRLSDQAAKNLETICRISGVNRTAAVEMSVAEMAVKLNYQKEKTMNEKIITIVESADWGGFDWGDVDEKDFRSIYNQRLAEAVAHEFHCRCTVETGDINPTSIEFEGFPPDFDEDYAKQWIEEVGGNLVVDEGIYLELGKS
jgi:predicted transcriptional regulator